MGACCGVKEKCEKLTWHARDVREMKLTEVFDGAQSTVGRLGWTEAGALGGGEYVSGAWKVRRDLWP